MDHGGAAAASCSPAIHPNTRSPEDVFRDYRARRAGIIKALTEDVEMFYKLCDPDKENLCLYGLPDETWAVTVPTGEVPPELPEPASGINFARDGMPVKDWLSVVATHSDSWLVAVGFYFAGRFGFVKEDRRRLFMMMNGLLTVAEIVSGTAKNQPKNLNINNKNKSGSKPPKESSSNSKPPKHATMKFEEDNNGREGRGDEDQALTMCGSCGGTYANGEFWICCDICEKWFHGKCVRITPAKAEYIKHYKCPGCSNKRSRE